MQCFRKFPVAKKFMDKRGGGGGSIKIFRRIFLSQCRKISQGKLCAASEISAREKVYG